MAKNDLKRRIDATIAVEKAKERIFTLQLSEDIMLRAAHTAFGFAPEALDKLRNTFRLEYEEWRLKLEEDHKDDKDLWYSMGVHERELRQILGKYYEEQEIRYGLKERR